MKNEKRQKPRQINVLEEPPENRSKYFELDKIFMWNSFKYTYTVKRNIEEKKKTKNINNQIS